MSEQREASAVFAAPTVYTEGQVLDLVGHKVYVIQQIGMGPAAADEDEGLQDIEPARVEVLFLNPDRDASMVQTEIRGLIATQISAIRVKKTEELITTPGTRAVIDHAVFERFVRENQKQPAA